MTGIYPRTLDGIAAFTGILDLLGPVSEDDGFIIEPVSLTSPVDGELIGVINFDADRHAYFIPENEASEETYVLTEKGEKVLLRMNDHGETFEQALDAVEREDSLF